MKGIILLFLSALACLAQPQLRIAVSNEFNTGSEFIVGPAGRGLSSLSVTEIHGSQLFLFRSGVRPTSLTSQRLLLFSLVVANVGDAPFDTGNFPLTMDWRRMLAIGGFVDASVLDTNGNVLSSRLISAPYLWDNLPVLPGAAPSEFTYPRKFGLSSGWAMWDDLAFVPLNDPVTGNLLADGDYILQLTVDPIGLWGQFDQIAVNFRLEGFNARLR